MHRIVRLGKSIFVKRQRQPVLWCSSLRGPLPCWEELAYTSTPTYLFGPGPYKVALTVSYRSQDMALSGTLCECLGFEGQCNQNFLPTVEHRELYSNYKQTKYFVITIREKSLKKNRYSGHRTGKGQFSFQSQRRAMPKNVQTTAQLHSSHTLAK